MFYDNYIRLCNSINKTPSAVAIEIGIAKPTVNRWKNGSRPTDATLGKIASYFGVSTNVLLGKEEDNKKTAIQTDDGNENEKEFIRLFLQLSPDEQMRELSYLREYVNRKDM